ncbi:FtsX-like permease family protein [Streptomyces silvisoli]|uniref:FtsX-like permease family protein n=1 Tax=Streptomyces silvisoli TaxID=3034235 RepID=A0ABT5ZW49_9ACTN|nr:FtsX-like permease family protein [Streptomyces silvisoli]MDF3293258.1 FtsX-like permease family protein [Streptomyces silvisoli]
MRASGLTKAAIRQIAAKPSRLLLTGCTLMVTAFFLAGSIVLTDTMKRQLADDLSTVAAGTAVVVGAAGDQPLDDKQVEELGKAAGVAGVQPVAMGSVLVKGAGRDPYPLVGTALTGPQSAVRPLRGTLPDGPGEVVLTRALAGLPGMGVGGRITLVAQAGHGPVTSRSAPARTVTVTVSGVVQAASAMGAAVLTTPANARSWLGTDGWQQALLRVTDRPAAEVASTVQGELGADFSVSTASELRAEESGSKWVTSVSTLLTIFVLVALLAGTFIVSTTYRVLLVRDQTRLALLRCVGARPGQVMRSVLLQAAASGLIAGAVGTVTAICCSFAITGIGGLPGPEISAPSLSGCVLVSVLAALAAAMPAARAAARVAPVAALSVAPTRHVADRIGRTRAMTGALCLGCALLLIGLVGPGGAGGAAAGVGSVASAVALFGCLLALGPALLRRSTRALHRPVRAVAGLDGALAVRNLGRAARRTAACATVLTLGITMVATVLVALASVEQGMDRRLRERDPVDVVLDASPTGSSALTPAVVDAVAALPETRAVVPVTRVDGVAVGGKGRGQGADIRGLDPGAIPALFADSRPASHGGGLRRGQAAISTSLAEALGVHPGDRISLRVSGGGKSSAEVSLIHPDDASMLGDVAVLPGDFAQLAPHAPVRSVYITAVHQNNPSSLRAPLDKALPLNASLHLTYQGEERAALRQTIDQLRIMALGLVGITMLVSLVGVAITLTLSSTERERENGVLRAVGMRGSRLRSVLAWEAGLLGLYAAVPGVTLGSLYGAMMLGALPGLSNLTIPYGQLAVTLVGALALVLGASVIPVLRSAAVSPMVALRADC